MKELKVLIACEESQRVCTEFRKRGFEAYSCDLLECGGEHYDWHVMGDVLPLLNGGVDFYTMDMTSHHVERWDLIIAHPPCTYLTLAGNRWFDTAKYGKKAEQRWSDRAKSAVFFMRFVSADCDHIAIENPIGVMSTYYKEANQIINPYQFGDPVRKPTCLWLKNLPLLDSTNIVEYQVTEDANGNRYSGPAFHARDENGKILAWNDPMTAKIRSRTYEGIARAMAEQWGGFIREQSTER